MLKGYIRIKEVNKYLSEVVSELQAKHGGVSSEAFEQELEERTGIKWKQVKNYRNHPNPYQILRPNNKIKDFVYSARKRALLRAIKSKKNQAIAVLVLTIFSIATVKIILNFKNSSAKKATSVPAFTPAPPKDVVYERIRLLSNFRIVIPVSGLTLQLGKERTQIKEFNWTSCLENGSYRRCSGPLIPKGIGRLSAAINDGQIESFSILTGNVDLINSINNQIHDQAPAQGLVLQKGGWWESPSELIMITEIKSAASTGSSFNFSVQGKLGFKR